MNKPMVPIKSNMSQQQGVVLLIALIILIVMSLAGAAAYRALTSAVGVSGNLSFKQTTLYGADKALNDGVTWVNQHTTSLINDNPTEGYFSAAPMPEPDWTLDSSWTSKKSAGVDALGNTLEYVIHRMCSQANTAYNGDVNQCMMLDAQSNAAVGNSMSAGTFQFTGTPQIAYRITARARGPKGGYTVVQTFMTLPQ